MLVLVLLLWVDNLLCCYDFHSNNILTHLQQVSLSIQLSVCFFINTFTVFYYYVFLSIYLKHTSSDQDIGITLENSGTLGFGTGGKLQKGVLLQSKNCQENKETFPFLVYKSFLPIVEYSVCWCMCHLQVILTIQQSSWRYC